MIIYKTTNVINKKIYIGQDSNDNPKYLGSGLLLHKAIKKYGKDNFKKEVLEVCSDRKCLNKQEIYWIKFYKATDKEIGYNISEGGTGGKLVLVEGKKGKTYEEYYGEKKAKELKALFSKIRKGKKRKYVNITAEEVGKKVGKALKGRKVSNECKGKISNTLKKYFQTEKGIKSRKSISGFHTGRKHSEESNKKRSDAMKGRRPKIMDIHPSARYWFFYDNKNKLIFETLGDKKHALEKLKTNQRKLVTFDNLNDCLNYKLEDSKHFKVFYKKYYKKKT